MAKLYSVYMHHNRCVCPLCSGLVKMTDPAGGYFLKCHDCKASFRTVSWNGGKPGEYDDEHTLRVELVERGA